MKLTNRKEIEAYLREHAKTMSFIERECVVQTDVTNGLFKMEDTLAVKCRAAELDLARPSDIKFEMQYVDGINFDDRFSLKLHYSGYVGKGPGQLPATESVEWLLEFQSSGICRVHAADLTVNIQVVNTYGLRTPEQVMDVLETRPTSFKGKAIEKIRDFLVDERHLVEACYAIDTDPQWKITVEGVASKGDKLAIAQALKNAGWERFEQRNSSEDNERPGMYMLTLYAHPEEPKGN